MNTIDIKSLTQEELCELLKEWGEPAFRGKQIFSWIHQKQVISFDEMTNISLSLREKLRENCFLYILPIKKKLVSSLDQTTKYLYELPDENCIETVRMEYHHGVSLCISTQVGCRMGCEFCASTKGGLVRNLETSEMLEEVYSTLRENPTRISSIVLMGIGEPLDNMENVIRFLKIISSPEGYQLGLRHITLSSCGMAEKIEELADYGFPINLSVSLHASSDQERNKIMPVNRKWKIKRLLEACHIYFQKTGRRITFEYALIAGVNDSPSSAKNLAHLLKGRQSHVNLIPINPVKERNFKRSNREAVYRFQKTLEENGIPATVRRELGSDIDAACGQLRHEQGNQGD